jgi:hypothetical protein
MVFVAPNIASVTGGPERQYFGCGKHTSRGEQVIRGFSAPVNLAMSCALNIVGSQPST